MRNVVVWVVAAFLAPAALARAQNSAPAALRPPADDRANALRVFVDCGDPACDLDYLRTEVSFVTYVRDRSDAQVHLLITAQQTADQGIQFTIHFIGEKDFRGVDDTLRHTAGPADSQDKRRSELTNVLKRGLVRYVNRTPLGERLVIAYAAPAKPVAPARSMRDPWNLWSFSTTVSAFVDGEESSSATSVSGAFSVNRTSDAWKIESSLQTRYHSGRVDAGEAGTFTTIQRNHAFNSLIVRSVNSRWSAGARATATSSTFLNQSLTVRLAPAIEYNVYPYTEATRRQFTLQYSVGATNVGYLEETIFGKTSETLLDERLLASVQIRQPWGSISSSLEGSHYLHDFTKKRAVAVTNLDVNIFRGLSLVTFGGVELVRDQLFLPKRGASTDEILLQQRQLATSFRYWVSLGVSYRFGSRFANVVNARFRGSSAGTSIIQ